MIVEDVQDATSAPSLPPYSRRAAASFAERWAGVTSEKQYDQKFWRDFFTSVCGIAEPDVYVSWQHPAKRRSTGRHGWIDGLWPKVALIEHKSAGANLDDAEHQARDYILSDAVIPPVIVVSDFARVRLVDVYADQRIEFPLTDLPDHVDRFRQIFEGRVQNLAREEARVNAKAAELMADLYRALVDGGYDEEAAQTLLVRVLFLNFGDDTRIWRREGSQGLFESLLVRPDGTPTASFAVGPLLAQLFGTLNQPEADRSPGLDPRLKALPYVNGRLFGGGNPIANFTDEMRDELVRVASYDWSKVDPMVFGSMFQQVKPKEERRELGAHYTSEANILKVLRPLFLDAIEEAVLAAWDDRRALYSLQTSLSETHYLDPACGSGNFLIVAYRELRRIEHRIVARLSALTGSVRPRSVIKLSQFHGIEIDQWPARIAWTAIILVQQQMDRELEHLLGINVQSHFPLKEQANILGGSNALHVDWGVILPASAPQAFIMGNPPFVGGKKRTKQQLADSSLVWGKDSRYGQLDFVANWFLLAARLMHRRPSVRAAFVSTNSITQGVQVSTVWGAVAALGSDIDFAHDSFKWSNGADNDAAVTVTAIGISPAPKPELRPVWRYTDGVHADLSLQSRINGTLADLPDVYPVPRSAPLSGLGLTAIGSQPNDGGNWSKLGRGEVDAIRRSDPVLAKYLVRVVGSDELLKGKERWGIDSPSITPGDAHGSAEVRRRAEAVASARKRSTEPRTVALGETPLLWQWYYHRATPKLLIPQIASQNYRYLPVAFADAATLVTNALFFTDDPTLVDFAALSSRHLRVWLDNVGGKLGAGNDPRFASDLVWNTFPFPALSDTQRQRVEAAAQSVLDVRASYGCPTPWRPRTDGENTLAALYHRVSMPADLFKTHRALDDAVDDAFGLPHGLSALELHGAMLDRYQALIDAEHGAAPLRFLLADV
jgi:hypothetical protein